MTKKAYAAIEAYALARCKGYTMYPLLIKFVLEAERMRRADLYAWLEKRGYRWNTHYWQKPEKPAAAAPPQED